MNYTKYLLMGIILAETYIFKLNSKISSPIVICSFIVKVIPKEHRLE
jgi:hypothetical protein